MSAEQPKKGTVEAPIEVSSQDTYEPTEEEKNAMEGVERKVPINKAALAASSTDLGDMGEDFEAAIRQEGETTATDATPIPGVIQAQPARPTNNIVLQTKEFGAGYAAAFPITTDKILPQHRPFVPQSGVLAIYIGDNRIYDKEGKPLSAIIDQTAVKPENYVGLFYTSGKEAYQNAAVSMLDLERGETAPGLAKVGTFKERGFMDNQIKIEEFEKKTQMEKDLSDALNLEDKEREYYSARDHISEALLKEQKAKQEAASARLAFNVIAGGGEQSIQKYLDDLKKPKETVEAAAGKSKEGEGEAASGKSKEGEGEAETKEGEGDTGKKTRGRRGRGRKHRTYRRKH